MRTGSSTLPRASSSATKYVLDDWYSAVVRSSVARYEPALLTR